MACGTPVSASSKGLPVHNSRNARLMLPQIHRRGLLSIFIVGITLFSLCYIALPTEQHRLILRHCQQCSFFLGNRPLKDNILKQAIAHGAEEFFPGQPDVNKLANAPAQMPEALQSEPDYIKALRQVEPIPEDNSEKYLTYIGCSGFHNQRIELANAFMLAHLLNRTLLMPRALLGTVVGWRPFDAGLRSHGLHRKNGLEDCAASPPGVNKTCDHANQYTYLSWEYLYNFNDIRSYVRWIEREDYSMQWLRKKLDIGEEDIFLIKDSKPYEYIIFELSNSSHSTDKYDYKISVDDLRRIPHKLIHFGSLYGGYRILLESSENKQMYDQIMESFVVSQPEIVETVDSVVERLGGSWQYNSLHVRVGDGMFQRNSRVWMSQIYNDLVRAVPPPPLDRRFQSTTAEECLAQGVDLLFLATDARSPRQNKLFTKFYNDYPCIITLGDVFDLSTSPINQLRSPYDNLPLGRFFIPLVDALVAARGEQFIPTRMSTFSRYVSLVRKKIRKEEGLPEKGRNLLSL
ncbi:uncharacterized protein VTP21DRAFT_6488 [Calcarisporiella thermophila]|uniref:uncharacterized protein n=1 Tax=Calcarisporiella thermophila TaxID=911321 RepID=UPI0037440AF0